MKGRVRPRGMVQRVPAAEKGPMRWAEHGPGAARLSALAQAAMGAPITASGYRASRFRQACTRRGPRREVWVNQGGNTAFFAVLERMLRDGVFICDHSKFIIKKKRGTGYGKGHFLYHNPHLLPLR